MERTIRCRQLFLTIAVLVVSASASFAQDAELLRHFDYDQKTPLNFKRYAAVVSEPKQFKLYDAPHALNAEARRDRVAFLTEQLKLKPLPAAAIAGIPNLCQPPAN